MYPKKRPKARGKQFAFAEDCPPSVVPLERDGGREGEREPKEFFSEIKQLQ
ncbi:MAG: hypothetical protein JRJ11_09660 [Deltaproteobacteria bacterium]|nr:hypothetical protein [Deltaproteobacteria bacterium]